MGSDGFLIKEHCHNNTLSVYGRRADAFLLIFFLHCNKALGGSQLGKSGMSIGGDVTGRPGGPQTSFWVPEAKELVSKRLIDQREGKPGYP